MVSKPNRRLGFPVRGPRLPWMAAAGLSLLALVVCSGAALAVSERPETGAAGGSIEVAQIFEKPLFKRLFGLGDPEPEPPSPNNLPGVRTSPGSGTAPKASNGPKPAVANPKNPDAKVVWVIGDRLADGLARGLNVALSDTPTVRIENGAVSPSGLALQSSVNWSSAIAARLAGPSPPDAVVVMIGTDDRRPMPVDGALTDFRTKSWEIVYRARVSAVIGAARGMGVPITWIGLVPMSDFDLTTDMAYLDEIYRQVVTDRQARYVDVWNAFADDTGGYAASGPDIAGQVRQLRLKDGIGFTKSGNRKLGFYVEQDIRSWLATGSADPALPTRGAEGGLVMSLSDPQAGPDDDLVTPAVVEAPREGTPLYDLVVLGKPLKPKTGRVDDLTLR